MKVCKNDAVIKLIRHDIVLLAVLVQMGVQQIYVSFFVVHFMDVCDSNNYKNPYDELTKCGTTSSEICCS